MLSKGQGATMGTYMTPFYLHLIWRIEWIRLDHCGTRFYIHCRSISKRLFSRMISLFDHHSMPNKIIE
ncbi:hypothetical protein Gohar_020055, partial [Gossypium harknessii]|nr:hypothetical protein [Gossypium harknessii]